MFLFSQVLCFIIFCSTPSWATEHPGYPRIIHNAANVNALPKQFRISTSTTSQPLIGVSDAGLSTLNASASGQFSVKGLEELLKFIPANRILIIDLREESHGFINGDAISWYGYHNWDNRGKSLSGIEADELEKLADLSGSGLAKIQSKASSEVLFEMQVLNVDTEQNVVSSQGAEYLRLPTTDHLRPEDQTVEQFLLLVKNLPAETWLHFHCAAGKGRASTFFVMYDMIRNAKNVSFDDIIKRQGMIGGKDLSEPEEDEWKKSYMAERLIFLQNFYKFCLEENPEQKSWSQWNASK